jgi:hypothetical protein
VNDKIKYPSKFLIDHPNAKHLSFKTPESYQIDFDKINTIEDIKVLFKGLNITFTKGLQNFEDIKHLVKKAVQSE